MTFSRDREMNSKATSGQIWVTHVIWMDNETKLPFFLTGSHMFLVTFSSTLNQLHPTLHLFRFDWHSAQNADERPKSHGLKCLPPLFIMYYCGCLIKSVTYCVIKALHLFLKKKSVEVLTLPLGFPRWDPWNFWTNFLLLQNWSHEFPPLAQDFWLP